MEHQDREVQSAIIRLSDALCAWKRKTGRKNILIVRERGFCFLAINGKPNLPDYVTGEQINKMIGVE